jgi:hypothetical protein
LNNYKELLQSIVNGEDKKDERDNVLWWWLKRSKVTWG